MGSNVGVLAWHKAAGPVEEAMEGSQMPAIVEYPQVVREALDEFDCALAIGVTTTCDTS